MASRVSGLLWSGGTRARSKFSKKRLQRYVDEFAGRYNARNRDPLDMMNDVVSGMVGWQRRYADLKADKGLSCKAWSRVAQLV